MASQMATYGSWKSPITADDVFAKSVGLRGIQLDGDRLYWSESRPDGRTVIVCRSSDQQAMDLTPAGYNVRTRVHEYGGGDYLAAGGGIYFSNFADQQMYRQVPGAEPELFTRLPGMRYADAILDEAHGRIIVVREDHTTGASQPVNALVSIRTTGNDEGQLLVSGNDFYATPRLNPEGTRLAWLAWNHPNMPWDGTELWVAEWLADGSLGRRTLVAGGKAESIFQPQWSPDGMLYFISDRTGWWNLYRWQEQNGSVEALCPMEAEFGEPQWKFGMSTFGFASADKLICAYSQKGYYHLASLDTRTLNFQPFDLPCTVISNVRVVPGQVFFIAGSATEPVALVQFDLVTEQIKVVRRVQEITLDPSYCSIAQPLEFPTDEGFTAHGFFYPPKNRDFIGMPEELPPLLVMSHGGPTGVTLPVFRYSIQYWTTRGFAVLDVNYAGSTGYGRAYRERLKGQWGIADVADCVNGARHLVSQGVVDGSRLAITGGSAGGYATLCALTFFKLFRAGASYYGVSDLEALARDTHKFESRYLDGLVGAYPERRDLYLARSPIHHIEQLACPLILIQGLDDPIVPPNQSQMMFDALRTRGLPVAYVTFAGEQHGFVKAENNKRALEAEFYFYSRIFKFELAEEMAPVPIENL
ncbi:prolyl oligopeptidase family serine peptidase [Nitrosomonas sp. Nm132]|uniref:S9 family peptidase n=1 Tax=Nitrosomonas sp. Nm132 TaxID=1881053 RepID=UPI00088CFD4D|nr:prolyl oligopeptidase family serine peptidase [Nitrosomonas sp. Nm132]SDH06333.1 Dipeptidyl aminopeptidase/acylaminoacyl peptidase [Nitrosomonas sp. Nm132]